MTECEIRNQALADAVKKIEGMHGNPIYERAWRKAAGEIKGMIVDFNASITDTRPQISNQ
jgi:hypothetical protein